MKIISYNVNGIRAAQKKGFVDWLYQTNADIVCLQEVKADMEQVDLEEIKKAGYHVYWHAAQKKGYSGVAILSKPKPIHVEIGCGIDIYDLEGRVIRADYADFSVISVYMPSGSSGDQRQAFKMKWLDDFYDYIVALRKEVPNLIISGDYNICHKPIDIHNPVSNKKSSGFLPEERAWVSKFIESGFIDTFRVFDESAGQYTWWSYRFSARTKNLGWRIDYHMVTDNLKERLSSSKILSGAVHSDHCPILLEIN